MENKWKSIRLIVVILFIISFIACNNETKTTSKEDKNATTLTLVSNDSINLKLTKIYNIGMMKIQEVEVSLKKDKNYAITEELNKLLFCFVVTDMGSLSFYIGPDMERSIELIKNDEGRLDIIFDEDDIVNNFTKDFSEKFIALFSIEGDENVFLKAVDKVASESMIQLNKIKSNLDNPSYNTLKAMVLGKMAHIKFMFSERFDTLTPASPYYDFIDELDFDNDYYLIYSDNINTLYNTMEKKYKRKYNSSFVEASDKFEFINENIKNDEIRSQFTTLVVSREIPNKSEKEKQEILEKLQNMKLIDNYYQYISAIEAGTAFGTKVGNQAKYFETLISNNKNFNMKSLHGKTLYVDNWATWCGPCMKSMQIFLKKSNEFTKEGITYVFVSFDRNKSIWLNYLTKKNFPKRNVVHLFNGSDLKSSYSKYFNILELPKYFIVNKEGLISDLNPPKPSDEGFEKFIKNIKL